MFSIQNQELEFLSDEIYKFNKLFSQAWKGFDDKKRLRPKAIESLNEKIIGLKKKLTEANKTNYSDFERLVYENIKDGLEAQTAYLDYYFNARIAQFEELIKKVYSQEAIDLVLEFTKDEGNIQLEELTPSEQADFDDFPSEGLLLSLKDLVLESCVQGGFLPKREEIESESYELIELSLARDGSGSGWRPGFIDLEPAHFKFYFKEDKIYLNPGVIFKDLEHEIGHLIHNFFSRGLPSCLKGEESNLESLVTVPIFEGLALGREGLQIAEELSWLELNFLKNLAAGYKLVNNRRIKRKLNRAEMEYAVLQNEEHWHEYLDVMAYQPYLKLKKTEAEALNGIEKVYQEHRFTKSIQPKISQTNGEVGIYYDLCYYFSYLFGKRQVEKNLKGLNEPDKKTLNAIISTGFWSWRVWPKWIEYALANIKAYRESYLSKLSE